MRQSWNMTSKHENTIKILRKYSKNIVEYYMETHEEKHNLKQVFYGMEIF